VEGLDTFAAGVAFFSMVVKGISFFSMVIDGIALFSMVVKGISFFSMVIDGIAFFSIVVTLNATGRLFATFPTGWTWLHALHFDRAFGFSSVQVGQAHSSGRVEILTHTGDGVRSHTEVSGNVGVVTGFASFTTLPGFSSFEDSAICV